MGGELKVEEGGIDYWEEGGIDWTVGVVMVMVVLAMVIVVEVADEKQVERSGRTK